MDLFAKPNVVKAHVSMLGSTWVRLMCNIEYLGYGGSFESSVWVQSVNSWCIWLLIKLFLKCCFTLHFLWFPYFQSSKSFPLDTFSHRVDGVNCWDRRPLGKGWRMRPGWNQGWEQQLGISSHLIKWEEGNELASPWLLFPGRRCCSETLEWGSAVPRVLQLVLPCSSPPCCLHCHRHLQSASSTLHAQHTSQTKSFFTSPPHQEGPEDYKPPLQQACLQPGSIWSEGYIWEKEEVFTLPLLFDVIMRKKYNVEMWD